MSDPWEEVNFERRDSLFAPPEPWLEGANLSAQSATDPWDDLLDGIRDGGALGRPVPSDPPEQTPLDPWCRARIRRPAFSSIALVTQDCFMRIERGLQPVPSEGLGSATGLALFYGDWPATSCEGPCAVTRPAVLPTPAEIDTALARTPLLLPPEDWLRPTDEPLAPNPGLSPIPFTRSRARSMGEGAEFDLLGAAVSLLHLNADLVDWVACLTEENRSMDRRYSGVSDIRRCMSWALNGGFAVYLISRFTIDGAPVDREQPGMAHGVLFPWPLAVTAPAEGGGSGQFDQKVFLPASGIEGAVIPVHHPNWVQRAQAVQRNDVNSFAAAVGLGAVILHEWMHRCLNAARPGTEDGYMCFALHSMLARSYIWAMGQRYPALSGSCLRVDDTRFMLGQQQDLPPSLNMGRDFRGAC